MAPPVKSKKPPILIIISIVISALVVAGYFYQQEKKKEQQQTQQLAIQKSEKQKQLTLAKKERDRAKLQALFDIYFNNFDADIRKQASIYKEQRKILKDIVSPYNFETPKYAKENYDIFKNELAPSLRKKASNIITIFEIYKARLINETKGKDNEIALIFLNQWEGMSKKILNHYIDFFTTEEQLIQAYDDLITFYYIHSNLISVDMEHNVLIFDRISDAKKGTALKNKIFKIEEKSRKNREASRAAAAAKK